MNCEIYQARMVCLGHVVRKRKHNELCMVEVQANVDSPPPIAKQA